jgi:hypothetical protein
MTVEISQAYKTWKATTTCPSCKRFIPVVRDFVGDKEVSKWRFGPHPDPLAEVQCPKCGARWPAWERKVAIEVVEGSRESKHAYFEKFSIDNSRGSSPLRRTQTISEEWVNSLEIGLDSSISEQMGMKLGNDLVSLTAIATDTLSSSYKVTTSERRVYTDELVFDVPAGVRRDVTLDFKRVWQLGHLVLSSLGSASATIPYQIQVGMNMDLAQQDIIHGSR